jgi:pimeloyl-ACP methyl ester carboxylesterase
MRGQRHKREWAASADTKSFMIRGRHASTSALAAAATILLLAPATAEGALSFGFCPKLRGTDFRCAKLRVPLDHTGQTPGSLDLDVRLLKARRQRRGTLVMLAGGPGQAGIGSTSIDLYVRDLIPSWDLVAINQRGTGGTALRCRSLDKLDVDVQEITAQQLTQRYVECSNALGPNRRFYTSIDSAKDIDALRAQLGLAKIAIGGTSYGTYVAQTYARLFPDQIERMLLDSVVAPSGVQAIYLSSFAASQRALAAQCPGSSCFGVPVDITQDVASLQQRMMEAPLNGKLVNRNGRPKPARMGGPSFPTTLFDIYAAGDLNLFLREEFPFAVRAALQGDAAPLLRLKKASVIDLGPPAQFSTALFAATTCAEDVFPWTPSQTFAERRASMQAAIDAGPDAAYVPWGKAVAAGGGELNGCVEWPESPFSGAPSQPLPDVPALLLVGQLDIRTPVEDAGEVAALLPRSTLITVPNTGHSVIGNASCAEPAVRRFMAGGSVGSACRSERKYAYSSGPIPRSISDLRPSGGASGIAGRTASAAALSILDATVTAQMFFDSKRFPGLRRGLGFIRGRFLEMRRYSFVLGVQLTGRLSSNRGRVKVRGTAAADGTLVRRGARLRGRLGGKRVSFRL